MESVLEPRDNINNELSKISESMLKVMNYFEEIIKRHVDEAISRLQANATFTPYAVNSTNSSNSIIPKPVKINNLDDDEYE